MHMIKIAIAAVGLWLLLVGAGGEPECQPTPEHPCIESPPNDGGSHNGASPA